MEFETALVFIAGVFLLLGIVGRVEVQSVRLGTDNRVARATTIAVGMILLVIALGQKTELFGWLRSRVSTRFAQDKPVPVPLAPKTQGYFIVISSTRSKAEAVARAKRIAERGYSAEVYRSVTGYFGVAVRAQSEERRSQIYAALLKEELAKGDAFFTAGERFVERVYP